MEMSLTPFDENAETYPAGTTVDIDWDIKLSLSDITKLLDSNLQLTELSLFYNGLNNEAVKMLFEGLKVKKTLEKLSLGLNNIGINQAQLYASTLNKNTTLKSLALTSNNFNAIQGDQVAQAFASMLLKNSTLTHLNLSDNEIGPDGFQCFGEALQVNTTLSSLDLSHNRLACNHYKYSQVGVDALLIMLQKNTTLKKLNLWRDRCYSDFKIHSAVSTQLAKALESNTTLTFLNLYQWRTNSINDFIHLLEINKLITLKLGGWKMPGATEFQKWAERVEFIEDGHWVDYIG